MHVERVPYIILALLGLVIILSFVPIELTIIYVRERGEDRLDLILGLFKGIFRFRILRFRQLARILVWRFLQHFGLGLGPVRLPGGAPPGDSRVTRLLLGFFKAGVRRYALPCRDFEISLDVGTGDAALTGMLVGSLWAAASPAIFSLTKFVRFRNKKPRISIRPDFSARRLDVRFRCILGINVGYIILRGIIRRLS
ncbi:MAG TPA: DUF2953 domain-containing protein [Firmicutes bacterium]|nr:DUF2953 domain-containing protein [Bacillota bacterium]